MLNTLFNNIKISNGCACQQYISYVISRRGELFFLRFVQQFCAFSRSFVVLLRDFMLRESSDFGCVAFSFKMAPSHSIYLFIPCFIKGFKMLKERHTTQSKKKQKQTNKQQLNIIRFFILFVYSIYTNSFDFILSQIFFSHFFFFSSLFFHLADFRG